MPNKLLPLAEESDNINRLERVIADAQFLHEKTDLKRFHWARSTLKSLGFGFHIEFIRALGSAHSRTLYSGDFAWLKAISHDRAICRKLAGSFLGCELLSLLSRRVIRRAVTRRFIMEMNHAESVVQQDNWYAMQEAVVAGLESGVLGSRRISSLDQFVKLAEVASKRINSAAYRFPEPPFRLPAGWRWFATGDDFKQLADYPAISRNHRVEFHHSSVSRGTAHLLRDPQNVGWMMFRMRIEETSEGD